MSIDEDEKLEKLCKTCYDDVTSDDKCIRCGKPTDVKGKKSKKKGDSFVNPNFDVERYNTLMYGTTPSKDDSLDEDVDYELVDKIIQGSEVSGK